MMGVIEKKMMVLPCEGATYVITYPYTEIRYTLLETDTPGEMS